MTSPVPVWEILIASVWARDEQLRRLLAQLEPQLTIFGGKVQVLIDLDNCATDIGVKRTRLVEGARAEYVCFVDDDDHVAPVYVARVMQALERRPDYVGFEVAFTIAGRPQKPVYHSLDCGGWFQTVGGYYRDISHLNPIRRQLALRGLPFPNGFGEDQGWAGRVRSVVSQSYIPEALYSYDYSAATSLFTAGPVSASVEPARVAMEHVRYLDG